MQHTRATSQRTHTHRGVELGELDEVNGVTTVNISLDKRSLRSVVVVVVVVVSGTKVVFVEPNPPNPEP